MDDSKLYVIVPQDTKVAIEDLSAQEDEQTGNAGSISAFGIEQRSLLYFGRCSHIQVRLRHLTHKQMRLR